MSSSLFLVRLSWFLNSIFCLIWNTGGCVLIWSLNSLNDLWPSKLLCSSPLPGRPARHCRRDLGSRVRGAARLLPASARSWRRQWDKSSLPWQRSLSGLIWQSSKLIFRIRPVKCSWPFRPDLTAFKVHFLIRTYHVFLTVMTRLLWIPEVLFASEKSELSYFLFDLLILILFSFLLILILFSFSKEKIPSFLVSCPICIKLKNL